MWVSPLCSIIIPFTHTHTYTHTAVYFRILIKSCTSVFKTAYHKMLLRWHSDCSLGRHGSSVQATALPSFVHTQAVCAFHCINFSLFNFTLGKNLIPISRNMQPHSQFKVYGTVQPHSQFKVYGTVQPHSQFKVYGTVQPHSQFKVYGNLIPSSRYMVQCNLISSSRYMVQCNLISSSRYMVQCNLIPSSRYMVQCNLISSPN